MQRHERLNSLVEIVADRGELEVDAVAAELAVSAATIRRDLDHLAAQQLLTRTRGGAVAHSVAYDLPLQYKAAKHATQKQRIARAAAALITPGMVIGLNGGTTTTEIARTLAARADLVPERDRPGADTQPVTIVTNALNIANELAVRPQFKLVVTGGVARPQSYELIGSLATSILHGLSLDIAFLGVAGIDAETGATAAHEGEADTNHLLASRARRVVVVADGSKVGVRAFARICPIAEIDTLITDDTAPAAATAACEQAGAAVTRAG